MSISDEDIASGLADDPPGNGFAPGPSKDPLDDDVALSGTNGSINITELDIPWLDNPTYPPIDFGPDPNMSVDSHAATGLGTTGNNQDTLSEPGDVVSTIQHPLLQITQQYINLMRCASLESSGMQAEDIDTMCNPEQNFTLVEQSPLVRSVCHFINNSTASQEHYKTLHMIEHIHQPDDPILSFNQVKRCVQWLSGVMPIEHNMCVNTCLAFTGLTNHSILVHAAVNLGIFLECPHLKSASLQYLWGTSYKQCMALTLWPTLCTIWNGNWQIMWTM
jgi:hypothetical protein